MLFRSEPEQRGQGKKLKPGDLQEPRTCPPKGEMQHRYERGLGHNAASAGLRGRHNHVQSKRTGLIYSSFASGRYCLITSEQNSSKTSLPCCPKSNLGSTTTMSGAGPTGIRSRAIARLDVRAHEKCGSHSSEGHKPRLQYRLSQQPRGNSSQDSGFPTSAEF